MEKYIPSATPCNTTKQNIIAQVLLHKIATRNYTIIYIDLLRTFQRTIYTKALFRVFIPPAHDTRVLLARILVPTMVTSQASSPPFALFLMYLAGFVKKDTQEERTHHCGLRSRGYVFNFSTCSLHTPNIGASFTQIMIIMMVWVHTYCE